MSKFREITKERLKELSETLRDLIGQKKPILEVATVAYLLDFYNRVTRDKEGRIEDYQGEALKAYTKRYFEDYEKIEITKQGQEKKLK